MDSNEFQLCNDLYRYGLKPNLLTFIPFQPQRISCFDQGCYIFESLQERVALWIYKGREANLAYQNQILKNFELLGVKGFLYPQYLVDGRTYAEAGEQCWFYLTSWPELSKLSFRNGGDLKLIVNLLVEFRMAVVGTGVLYCLSERKINNNLLQKYQELIRQLNSFGMLAKYRLKPRNFDHLFLAYLPEIISQAKSAYDLLSNSKYLSMIGQMNTQDMIINNLTRHNLRKTTTGDAVCLRIDNYQWNLAIIDLAILLTKSGRSCKWSNDWYRNVLEEYQNNFKISLNEFEVIKAYLAFPWSLYRLAARYYYNRVDWSLRVFIEKVERLLADEPNRLAFLKSINTI